VGYRVKCLSSIQLNRNAPHSVMARAWFDVSPTPGTHRGSNPALIKVLDWQDLELDSGLLDSAAIRFGWSPAATRQFNDAHLVAPRLRVLQRGVHLLRQRRPADRRLRPPCSRLRSCRVRRPDGGAHEPHIKFIPATLDLQRNRCARAPENQLLGVGQHEAIALPNLRSTGSANTTAASQREIAHAGSECAGRCCMGLCAR